MARRLGPYAPLSAMYASDDAIIAAGEDAELLYVRGLAFCAGMVEQDGYITDAQLKRFVGAGMDDTEARAQTLVREGLWEREDGGYIVRAWLKWNKSSNDLGRERKKDRDRKAARADEVRAALIPEGVPDSVHDSGNHSARNPDGIQTESVPESGEQSKRTPDGFQPRAPAREAGARVGASGAALHSTALHNNPQTPAASGEGREGLFDEAGSPGEDPGEEPPPCPKHAASMGRRHGNCRACGTSARAADRVEDEAEFNKFWEIFPHRVGPGAARVAWVKARKKVEASVIIAGAERFRESPAGRKDPEFIPHPATWLNQERWADRPAKRPDGHGGWWDN